MLLVAVMEPDVGDSLPRIGDDHWFRFYMILGANGALAFLVRRCSRACRSPLRDVQEVAADGAPLFDVSVDRPASPSATRAQVNLTNFLVTRYTSALTLQVGFTRRLAGCHIGYV
jgi:hypothetical protein